MLLAGEYSYPFWLGELFLTAEYRIFRANDYEVTKFGADTGYATDGSGRRGMITPYVLATTDGLPAPDGRFDSIDFRRSNLDGFTSKLAYRHRLGSVPYLGNVGAQAGLTLSYLSLDQYASGSINVLERRDIGQNSLAAATTAHAVLAESWGKYSNESFMEENQTTAFAPGVFVGARTLITDNLFFEMNLSVLGYSEINYVPASYTGKAPYTETSSHYKTVLEFAAGFRF
jgi:hypothetical protein